MQISICIVCKASSFLINKCMRVYLVYNGLQWDSQQTDWCYEQWLELNVYPINYFKAQK